MNSSNEGYSWVYHDAIQYALGRAFADGLTQKAGIFINRGYAFTDSYDLFERQEKPFQDEPVIPLPVELSPTYPTSQLMVGLDLIRFNVAPEEQPIRPDMPFRGLVKHWYAGDSYLTPTEVNMVGAARFDSQTKREIVLVTTATNLLFATRKMIELGAVDVVLD